VTKLVDNGRFLSNYVFLDNSSRFKNLGPDEKLIVSIPVRESVRDVYFPLSSSILTQIEYH